MMLDNINAPQWMQLKLTPKTSNYGVIFLNAVSYPCLCRSRNQINKIIKILVDIVSPGLVIAPATFFKVPLALLIVLGVK